MTLTKTPICDFGKKAENFQLNSTKNKIISLSDIKGENGTIIMFICNHCPYVKAVIKEVVEDCKKLEKNGIKDFGFASPFGTWNNSLRQTINYFNFKYSSELTKESFEAIQ